jgi:ArsR family transcriptional regulator, arsenate/arsenite/antimonite-responsive transcriptional repressor
MKLDAATFARVAKALADPQRCEILEKTAAAGELSCAVLCELFPVSQATISHHLKELATAGLLERRKDGQFAFYRFMPDILSAYLGELEQRMGMSPRPRRLSEGRRSRPQGLSR